MTLFACVRIPFDATDEFQPIERYPCPTRRWEGEGGEHVTHTRVTRRGLVLHIDGMANRVGVVEEHRGDAGVGRGELGRRRREIDPCGGVRCGPHPLSGRAMTLKAVLSDAMVTRGEPVPVAPLPIRGVTPLICATFTL